MSGYRFVLGHRRVRAATAMGCVWLVVGCKQATTTRTDESASPEARPERGDRVVVEPRAAEFFEARVLSVGEGQLRVQPSSGAEPMSVALADVYPLPQPKVIPKPGRLLVCRVDERWVGCQAETVLAGRLAIRGVSGARLEIPLEEAFAPTQLTELNLKRAFALAAERARFVAAASRAGEPARPIGFRLQPKARVVARRRDGWYSGTIHEIDDGGAYIAFAGQELREHIATTDIVPAPPHPAGPTRGDFALVRPQSPAEPWVPVRIVSAAAGDFKVATESGEERLVPLRDLLPLVAELR